MSAAAPATDTPFVLASRKVEVVAPHAEPRRAVQSALLRDDRGALRRSSTRLPRIRRRASSCSPRRAAASRPGHDLKEMRAHAGDEAWQRRLFDDCSRMMLRADAPAAAGHRAGARDRDGRRLPARLDVRPRRRRRHGDVRAARRQHRRLLHDAGRRRRAQRRPQARDGAAPDGRADRRATALDVGSRQPRRAGRRARRRRRALHRRHPGPQRRRSSASARRPSTSRSTGPSPAAYEIAGRPWRRICSSRTPRRAWTRSSRNGPAIWRGR